MSVKVHEAFSFDSFQDRLLFFDDFHGDQVQDEWLINGTGTGVVVDAQTGGIIRLTTGATNTDTMTLNWNNIRSLLVTKKVTFEARIKIANITAINANIGFWDDGNNHIVFVESGGDWLIRCRDDAATTQLASGVTMDTDYHIYRIECFPTDEVHFYIDGTETGNSPITTNIPNDADDYLQPYISIQTTEDVAKTLDTDYVYVRQER